ncbi:MAG: disulfide bond formation protein B [Pseudomonadota bacterium]
MFSRLKKASLIRLALVVGAAASASLLAGAHAFERAGFAPCDLCLDQREAHWAALAVAFAGLVSAFVIRARLVAAASVGALALVYALSTGLAFYHTGVEFSFWAGPASCSQIGDSVTTLEQLQEGLKEAPAGPACNEAPWRLFGVSMAGYNMLASAGLFALAMIATLGAMRRARQDRRPAVA